MNKSVTINSRARAERNLMEGLNQQLPRYYSKDEVHRFFAVIPRSNLRDLALFDLIYRHGLRRREASLLKRLDVAFFGRTGAIRIFRLKGSNSGVYHLHPTSARLLSAYLRNRGDDGKPYLFPGRRLDAPLSPSMIYRLFRRYATAAGLPEDRRHPHSFRHSWGVHASNSFFDLLDIADWLGHKSLAAAQRYAAVTNQRRDGTYSRVLNSLEFARTV
jgi:integrase